MANEENLRHLNLEEIEQMIPHRRPFLFLEEVEIAEPGKRANGRLTDLTEDEFAYLKGHFPGNHIVPGAILMEALAELSGVALMSGTHIDSGKIGVLMADQMRYKSIVKLEDQILLEAEVVSTKMNISKSRVTAFSNGNVAAEGIITFGLVDKNV